MRHDASRRKFFGIMEHNVEKRDMYRRKNVL